MKYKKLGKSDLEVSVVGLGCMMFGSMCDQQQTNDVVDVTIDEGINMFDVADIYGHPRAQLKRWWEKRWAIGAKTLCWRPNLALRVADTAVVSRVAVPANT